MTKQILIFVLMSVSVLRADQDPTLSVTKRAVSDCTLIVVGELKECREISTLENGVFVKPSKDRSVTSTRSIKKIGYIEVEVADVLKGSGEKGAVIMAQFQLGFATDSLFRATDPKKLKKGAKYIWFLRQEHVNSIAYFEGYANLSEIAKLRKFKDLLKVMDFNCEEYIDEFDTRRFRYSLSKSNYDLDKLIEKYKAEPSPKTVPRSR